MIRMKHLSVARLSWGVGGGGGVVKDVLPIFLIKMTAAKASTMKRKSNALLGQIYLECSTVLDFQLREGTVCVCVCVYLSGGGKR